MLKNAATLIRGYKWKKILVNNTFDVLRPINIISYITGFRAFEYPRGHIRSRLSFFYVIFLYSFYYVGWQYQGHMLKETNVFNLQGAIYQMTGAFSQVAMFVILIVGWHQSKPLRLFTRRIHEVDVTLRALGSPGYFNILYKKMIGMITFVISHLTLFIGLHVYVHLFLLPSSYKWSTLIFSIFVQLYGQTVEYILLIEFFVIVSCIDSEFQRANDLLRDINVLPFSSIAMELLDCKNSKDPFSTNKSFFETSTKLFTLLPSSRQLRSHLQMTSHEIIRSRRLLQTIRQVHLELYRVSKRISMIYGIQTSTEMSMCILYTTYFIYSLYYTYQHESYNSAVLLLSAAGTFVLCFNNAVKIFLINYICERTSRQAQCTNEIIYTFYGQSTDSELQEEMEMFSLQMMHCRIIHSSSGLYSLNYKNICACVGMITTYVVIMIQVTSSIEEEIS